MKRNPALKVGDALMTVADLAGELGVSPQRISQLISSGQCPIRVVRFGRRVYFPRVAWEEFLAGSVKTQERESEGRVGAVTSLKAEESNGD